MCRSHFRRFRLSLRCAVSEISRLCLSVLLLCTGVPMAFLWLFSEIRLFRCVFLFGNTSLPTGAVILATLVFIQSNLSALSAASFLKTLDGIFRGHCLRCISYYFFSLGISILLMIYGFLLPIPFLSLLCSCVLLFLSFLLGLPCLFENTAVLCFGLADGVLRLLCVICFFARYRS